MAGPWRDMDSLRISAAAGSRRCVDQPERIGAALHEFEEQFPRITCRGSLLLFGLRRRFLVKSRTGQVLFSYRYWRGQGRDFYRWLALNAGKPEWRTECSSLWSAGVAPSAFPLPRQ
jgi:hypothetical protein